MRPNITIHEELIKGWGFDANSKGELIIGGCNAVGLGNFYGTPVHIVNEAGLRIKAYSFLETLISKYPGKVSVHFAFKCNPVPGIIKILKDERIKAEIMSEFELDLAFRMGFSGDEIVVNGPYKTDQLLIACLKNNIRFINVDSLFELEKINQLCNSLNKKTEVLLRVNPDFIPAGMNRGSIAASRSGSHFGIDINGGELRQALERIKRMKQIIFKGLHFHIGSGIQDPSEFLKAIKGLKKAVNEVDKAGYKIEVLDVGGGLGLPTSCEMTTKEMLFYQAFDILRAPKKPNNKLTFAKYAEYVTSGVMELFSNKQAPELIFEPGRCITGPNQLLLISIHQVKDRKGVKKWLVSDAGIGTLTMPTYYEHHKVILCNNIWRKPYERVTICGPGCFSADVVYRNKLMPKTEAGEMLAILDTGAYFTSWESTFGYPRPAIVSVLNGSHRLIRSRESFENMISRDIL
jgi:diaminopimelate decarboxylase